MLFWLVLYFFLVILSIKYSRRIFLQANLKIKEDVIATVDAHK